jgi:hypothetical protein
MIVYLAGVKSLVGQLNSPQGKSILNDTWILSSFVEWRRSRTISEFVMGDKHILDSGAYSTFKDIESAKKLDWDQYVKDYINFIKTTDQKLFFELDIDSVVGLKKVEYYRDKMTDVIGRQPIPVWHSNRGWEYYLKMCEEFPYVSIGTTTATNDGVLMRKQPMILKKFIDEAHKKNAKIHGLGFTHTSLLPKLNFDSVDSTTWAGSKYGRIYRFTGIGIKDCSNPNKAANKKLKGKTSEYHLSNFLEWLKYQQWAEKNL